MHAKLIGDAVVFVFSEHLQTISDREIAGLNLRAGQLSKDAADAQIQAEKLDTANNGLGQILLPRHMPTLVNMQPFLAQLQSRANQLLLQADKRSHRAAENYDIW